MNLFYAKPGEIQGSNIFIQGQEAEHITKVLRHSKGDEILVTDGKGKLYNCLIKEIKRNSIILNIQNAEKKEMIKPAIILCMGVIKRRDRLEFAVEKAVELGVSKIVLFKGEHSQKGNVRTDRIKNTAVSAMKQSLRSYLPDIVVENSLSDALHHYEIYSEIVVADETRNKNESDLIIENDRNFFLIVGPEGGFSDSERESLNKFDPCYYSLGKMRLRAETAAIVMVDRFANRK